MQLDKIHSGVSETTLRLVHFGFIILCVSVSLWQFWAGARV